MTDDELKKYAETIIDKHSGIPDEPLETPVSFLPLIKVLLCRWENTKTQLAAERTKSAQQHANIQTALDGLSNAKK